MERERISHGSRTVFEVWRGPELRIVLQLAPDIPMCPIDPSQFNAAILNLVLNARDAMSDSGDVQIGTARCVVKSTSEGLPTPGLYVQVRVKDSGQCTSAETVRNIFDPFFTTKGENGTGLGLRQVCAFMRRIGGHVSVTSELGIGTTFDLLFPAAPQNDTAEAYPDPSGAARTNEQIQEAIVTKPMSRRQSDMRYPSVVDACSEGIEAMSADDILWRQIDRWVNEGGAVGAGTTPSATI